MNVVTVLIAAYVYLLIAGTVGAIVYRAAIPWAEQTQKRKYPALYRGGELGHANATLLGAVIGAFWPLAIPVAFGIRFGMGQSTPESRKVDA